jgi:uncharacterized protein
LKNIDIWGIKLSEMTRAEGLEMLKKHLKKPQHTVLTGARQLGKTTLTKQLVQYLESQQQVVHYLSFEDPTLLNAINEHPNNLFKFITDINTIADNQVLYVVIDEVQYAKNPTNFLKYLYDTYAPKLKLIVTGSSAFYIDRDFKDSLAGRKQVFELYPLGFDEFLHFKGENKLQKELKQLQTRSNYIGTKLVQLNSLFQEYILYGGYPAVVLAKTTTEKEELLKDLVNSFLKKDALEAGVREDAKFFQLVRILAEQVGMLINQNELANTLKVSVGTVDSYLYLLNKIYIVQIVRPKYSNIRKELIKMPKLFFTDTGLRNSLCNNFSNLGERADKGNLFENAVFTRLRKIYGADTIKYWRTTDGSEVDFIIDQSLQKGLAFEAKYSDILYKPSKFKKFMNAYPDFPLQVVSMEVDKLETIPLIRL